VTRRGLRDLGIVGLLLLVAPGPAAAQQQFMESRGEGQQAQSVGPIEPDRPDAASSAKTVAPGAFQIETGIAYSSQRFAAAATERRLSQELTLRLGLTDRLEVRLEGEPVVNLRGAEDTTNVGDFRLGLKYRFLDSHEGAWWPALAVQPFVKIASAPDPIGSERTDFGAVAIATFDLPANFTLDVNGGITAVGQRHSNGFLPQGAAAGSLSKTVFGDLTAFVELFGATRTTGDSQYGLGAGAGVIYLIRPWLAVDLAVQTSLAGQLPDYTIRSGFSIRFGP
jgi:outer membrane putative beta-barrel porin/alpha-amylase